ncbi:type II toxin-antitoxin system RelE/ParE family toxin [Erwinia mallotivora]|uniref:type II toxin-antitoxin system RelE/ParE family toxin n=1 Tax=Erwinia mallotivora TaxID=69222 RepID=UPI0035E78A36
MTLKVEWSRDAQADREAVYRYLYQEAGLRVADATDEKLRDIANILAENPHAGVKTGRVESRRKLVVPKFPFIMVYVVEPDQVWIARVLHTSRKIAGRYGRS